MAIVSLDDAKRQLNIPASDTTDDVELQSFVDAATASVETQLGQVVGQRTVVDQLDFTRSTTAFLLQAVPVISLTSLVSLDGAQAWTVTPPAMYLDGASGCITVLSGPPVKGSVLATYQAGYTAIPANIRLAALIIIQHLWETQRGNMGSVPGGSDEPQYMIGRGFALPRRALELLGSTLPGVA
jgi:uncharacterized phiE125 gp8 family phage protein